MRTVSKDLDAGEWDMGEASDDFLQRIRNECQTALKIDPVSASNIDPVMAVS